MTPRAADIVAARLPGFSAEIGFVLGSGFGGFAESCAIETAISYADLPGFSASAVAGHAGRLVLGHLGRHRIAILQGRKHYYESGRIDGMKAPIACLRDLGCRVLIVTNAAGSLRPEIGPGSIVAITDHLNLTQVSPLFGETGNNRFVDMRDAYDPALRRDFRNLARELDLDLAEGIYAFVSGPQFETPAEIRMAKALGADLVGMSTIPDVILARYFGMKVAGFSIVTNLGAGMSDEDFSHEHTMREADRGAAKLSRLIRAYLERF